MAKERVLLTVFSNGEITPLASGRVDLKQYKMSVAKARNVFTLPQGPLIRRHGLRHIMELSDLPDPISDHPNSANGKRLRLFDLDFDSNEGYLFVFEGDATDGDAHIIWAGGRARPGTKAKNRDEDYVNLAGDVVDEADARDIGGLVPGAYDTETNRREGENWRYITTVSHPYSANSIVSAQWVADGDTMIIAHPSVAPQHIKRTNAHDYWVGSSAGNFGPYELNNVPGWDFGRYPTDGIDISSIAKPDVGGAGTLTVSTGIFTAEMVGWSVYNLNGGGTARITQFNSTTSVNVVTRENWAREDADLAVVLPKGGDWQLREPVWSDAHGWPSTIGIYDARLAFASTQSRPQAFWLSRSSNYNDFDALSTRADYGIQIALNRRKNARIQWIVDGPHLQLLTNVGAFFQPDSGAVLTPTNANFKYTVEKAPEPGLEVFVVSGGTIFVNRGGNALIELIYDETKFSLNQIVLSKLADHLMRRPVDLAFAEDRTEEGTDRFFLCNRDGTLTVFNTIRDQEINGWTLCETEGAFRSVGVVQDKTWFITERGGRQYLEQMEEGLLFDSVSDLAHVSGATTLTAHQRFIDVGKIYIRVTQPDDASLGEMNLGEFAVAADGTVDLTTRIDGSVNNYFAFTGIQVGFKFPDVTLDFSEDDPHYGTGYETFVRTLEFELELQSGSQAGVLGRVTDVSIDVQNTVGLYVRDELTTQKSFDGATIFGGPSETTGRVDLKPGGAFNKLKSVHLGQKAPGPMTVKSIAFDALVQG